MVHYTILLFVVVHFKPYTALNFIYVLIFSSEFVLVLKRQYETKKIVHKQIKTHSTVNTSNSQKHLNGNT